MNHGNITKTVNKIFMYLGRNFISNYTANEHKFYYYLYWCSREDCHTWTDKASLPELTAWLLEKEKLFWKVIQSKSLACYYSLHLLKESISLHWRAVRLTLWMLLPYAIYCSFRVLKVVQPCWHAGASLGSCKYHPLSRRRAKNWATLLPVKTYG